MKVGVLITGAVSKRPGPRKPAHQRPSCPQVERGRRYRSMVGAIREKKEGALMGKTAEEERGTRGLFPQWCGRSTGESERKIAPQRPAGARGRWGVEKGVGISANNRGGWGALTKTLSLQRRSSPKSRRGGGAENVLHVEPLDFL